MSSETNGPKTRRSPERLGQLFEYLLRYRLYSSPEHFARAHPNLVGLQATNLRQIIKGKDGPHLSNLKLAMLTGALALPPKTLQLILDGDTAGLRALTFTAEDEPLKQWIIDEMTVWGNSDANRSQAL